MQGKGLLGGLAAAFAAALLAAPAQALETVPGEVIVQFADGAGRGERADALADSGTDQVEGLGAPGTKLVEVAGGGSVAAAISELEADPAVKYAEPNAIERPQAVPNDPSFPGLWGLLNAGQSVNGAAGTPDADIDANEAWDIGIGSPDTVVAIMDSGADLTHPDLASQLWQNPKETPGNGVDDDANGFVDDVNGVDFFDNDTNPTDTDSGHGTHVAGTAVARGDDGFGITGVSQRAQLMVLRVCGFIIDPSPGPGDPPGSIGCIVSDQIEAINYAAANGAKVLNGSLGGAGGTENLTRRDAIASHPGTLYVFAAGNGGADSVGDNNDVIPSFPCAHGQPSPPVVANQTDNIVCVAASTQFDTRPGFSNFGATTVDLAAPGTSTLSDSGERDRLVDNFSAGALAWTQSGSQPWALSSEAPLTTQGVTDSPGGNYLSSQSYVITSPAVTLPAGLDGCELQFLRARDFPAGNMPTDDVFRIEVLLNGAASSARTFNFSTDAAFASGASTSSTPSPPVAPCASGSACSPTPRTSPAGSTSTIRPSPASNPRPTTASSSSRGPRWHRPCRRRGRPSLLPQPGGAGQRGSGHAALDRRSGRSVLGQQGHRRPAEHRQRDGADVGGHRAHRRAGGGGGDRWPGASARARGSARSDARLHLHLQ